MSKVQLKSSRLNRIATELNDAEHILKEIGAQKRTQPALSSARQIEAVLSKHPAVEEVIVLWREDVPSQKCLVAYVVADREHSPIIDGRPRYLLPNKMAIVHQNRYETDVLYKEIFEENVYLKHGITVTSGDCVFDVGANIGLFTLFVQQICKETRVYAFEPAPPIFELLRLNTTLYGSNVKLFNVGLSNETKTATLTFYPQSTAHSGYYADAKQEEETFKATVPKTKAGSAEEIAVYNEYTDEFAKYRFESQTFVTQLRSLSEIITENNIERINLLKIDVEKSELAVLAGMKEEDWQKIQQIIVEVYDEGGRLSQIKALLEEQDYDVIVYEQSLSGLYMLYAKRHQVADKQLGEKPIEFPPFSLPILSNPLLSDDELRHFLKEKFRQPIKPLAFVFLDALPRMENGEVDDSVLPAPDEANVEFFDEAFFAPRTPVEAAVAEIWAEFLGVEKVGIHDDFFDLGGHSLLATQVLSRMHEAFEVELPLKLLFTGAFTVADLAKTIEQEQIQQASTDEIAAILKELDELSDDEVKVLLAEEEST